MIEAIKPNKFRFEFSELVIQINLAAGCHCFDLDSPSKARNKIDNFIFWLSNQIAKKISDS